MPLPFPGLVFVPLDILTAEEQNEIVANYTYIYGLFPVSASNIDFTTITDQPNDMPMATKTSFNIGYSTTVTMVRIGNIVALYSGTQVRELPAIARSQLTEKIPSGYRPIRNTGFQAVWQDGQSYRVSWEVETSGTMFFSSSGAANARFCINATWITNDPFPTGDIPS